MAITTRIRIGATLAALSPSPTALAASPVGGSVTVPRPEARLLVDESAGAVVRAQPRGRIVGMLPGRTALGTPTWLWAVATSRDGRWDRRALRPGTPVVIHPQGGGTRYR